MIVRCNGSLCGCSEIPATLWEKEVLLMRQTFEIPPIKKGHVYRLILGGAIGNLYDRVQYDAVRDFIEVWFGDLKGWHWPTFNVADIALVVGIGLLILRSFRSQEPEEEAAA